MTEQAYAAVHNGNSPAVALTANWILQALPPAELETLRSHASLVALQRHDVLFQPRELIERVYFPVDGIVSLVCVMRDGGVVETATIGREGMVGSSIFHCVTTTTQQTNVQVPG